MALRKTARLVKELGIFQVLQLEDGPEKGGGGTPTISEFLGTECRTFHAEIKGIHSMSPLTRQ